MSIHGTPLEDPEYLIYIATLLFALVISPIWEDPEDKEK